MKINVAVIINKIKFGQVKYFFSNSLIQISNKLFKVHHSILCISEIATWKSLTQILSSELPAISLALLYIALNFPIL